MSPPKHVDLLVLAAAAVVFALCGFSLLGYVAAAVAWLAQRGIQWLAQRRSTSRPGSPPLSTIRLLSPNVGQDCPGDRDRGEQNALDRER